MKATPNDSVTQVCILRARKILSGQIVLPEVHYTRARDSIHLSDLQDCPAYPYYQKILGENAPENDDKNILYFVRGRAIERFFAEEQPQVTCDGISCTADGFQEGNGYLEIKTTAEQMDFFDPIATHPEWTERIMGYCHAYMQTRWNLVVFFAFGNAPNKLWWNIKEFGKSKEKYVGIALKSWTLEFSDLEIEDNWIEVKRRRDMLQECLDKKIPPSDRWIEEQTPDWRHKICQMRTVCKYMETPKNYKADGTTEDILADVGGG